MQKQIAEICARYDNDATRMLDILWEVQNDFHWISPEAMAIIAAATNTYRVEVEGVATFYAFFKTERPQGKFEIYLCDDIIDRHAGMAAVQTAIEEALDIKVGETSEDGLFSLQLTPCIGMSDQAPAALINNHVFTSLTPAKIKTVLRKLRRHEDLAIVVTVNGEGNNNHPLVRSMVKNNIHLQGAVLFGDYTANKGLTKALSLVPNKVLLQLEEAHLQGRGGAGYLTTVKWHIAAEHKAEKRFVICNADEGEPGTFKDRVLLTERADLMIEGMTIAAYAIGSAHGILYVRAEYRYLVPYLEEVLEQRRNNGLLGKDILIDESEHTCFSFDIRIQLGAGAYICGEESSLISSCEGKRGEPKNKPPYPAESGYLGYPTIVNNVETYCNIPPILTNGASWFKSIGTKLSYGTKLLSVAGDCDKPGIYEVPMGISLNEVLKLAKARDPEAVQVGGASGAMVGSKEFNRRLCFEDLPTAGAITIFSRHRNILDIVDYYMHFFIEESCGYCTPCRVGNVFMKKGLEKIMQGLGDREDLTYLSDLGETIIATSRCGLGKTSPNPILSSLENFPLVYAALLKERNDGCQAGFDIQRALDDSRHIAKRRSIIFDPNLEGDND